MKTLPEMRWRGSDDARGRLAAWLREWEIERRLGGAPAAAAAERPVRPGRTADRPAPWEGEPAPEAGQIRLLAPADGPSRARPVYIALLEPAPAGRWLAAPFGRFAAPAVPGEWATGLKASPLRVLCVWNARRLGARRAARSWVVGRLPRCALESALELRKTDRVRKPAPEKLAAAVGPPLTHPLDPRWAYLDEERDFMDALAAEADAGEEGGGAVPYPFAEGGLALAAEPHGAYESGRVLLVRELGLRLRLTREPGGGWRIQVQDENGAPSPALDGASLRRTGARSPAATIRRGRARWPAGPPPVALEIRFRDGRTFAAGGAS